MSRTMPHECEHGRIVDWGDFGPEDGSLPDPCPECEAARLVFYYCDGTKRIYQRTPSHCIRTPFRHKHSRCGWKILVDRD